MAAKKHYNKILIGFAKSKWFLLEEVITIEWFRLFVENQDILKIDDIYKKLCYY